jgi:hypothetical protein
MKRFRSARARFVRWLALAALLSAVAGCSKTKVTTVPTAPAPGSLTVHFDHTTGGAALVLNPHAHLGTDGAGNRYSVETLRYIVSNIHLHAEDGSFYGVEGFHYRDAAVPGTRDYVLSGIPPGMYMSISFTFGLDEMMNVPGPPIANVPGIGGMEWPPNWGGGWHYLMLQGFYDPARHLAYRTHMGRRFIAGTGDPSGQGPDSVEYNHDFNAHVMFPAPVMIEGDSWQTTLTMEIDSWYRPGSHHGGQGPAFDLAAFFPNGSGEIMVDLTAQKFLQQNGPGCFTASSPTRR